MFIELPPHLLTGPFTLADARAAGLTDDTLSGPTWRQVFRGIWISADLPDTRRMRFRAARLVLPDHGVFCVLTAAWLHGVDVRWEDDLDVHVGFAKGKRVRSREGLRVCQETLDPADVTAVDGVALTTPLRTAFDCLRLLHGGERLVVADALTHAGLLSIPELRSYFAGKKRLRNLRIGEGLIDAIEPKTESPMESRTRAMLLEAGLPRPEAQWDVRDQWGHLVGRLDLAYPEAKLGIEYDGADHWWQRRADDRRRAAMRALGWEIVVVSAEDIFRNPMATASAIARLRRQRLGIIG